MIGNKTMTREMRKELDILRVGEGPASACAWLQHQLSDFANLLIINVK